jgi:hypothetical protein
MPAGPMPVADLSTTTLATPVCAPLGLLAIGWVDTAGAATGAVVADLSSTGTSSSFTPEAQPAKRPTNTTLAHNCFCMIDLVK